jgi:acetate kinase
MDSILVVNAGSSSVKFEVFAVDGPAKLTRKIKGQIDGIGTRPRLRASGANGTSVIDREYDAATIPDVPAALQSAGTWLREEQRMPPNAVGHRVVHGGPEYNGPVSRSRPD